MIYLHFFTYFSALVFILMITIRIIRLAKAPRHLRWELYPVPHEKGKAEHGGSRLEDLDWWTKPVKKGFWGEFIVMAEEIFFLKGVWEKNRKLWLGSFPFHFALYLLIFNMAACLGITLAIIAKVDLFSLFMPFSMVIRIIAWVASVMGTLGAVWLLLTRITDKGLAKYSTPSHYFNIILIGGIYFTLFLWLNESRHYVGSVISYMYAIIRYTQTPTLPTAGVIHITLSLIFLIYLPFTHMTHFFAKYFTYHKVRWEDEPNLPGSGMRKAIGALLNQKVTWAAPHICADGSKTWIALVNEKDGKEGKNEK